jgi:hypothetical protein
MSRFGQVFKSSPISNFDLSHKTSRAIISLCIYAVAAVPTLASSQTIRWYCVDEKAESKGWGRSNGDAWEEIRMDDRRRFLLTPTSPITVERKDTQAGRIYIEKRMYTDSTGNTWNYSSWDAHPVFKTANTTIYCYP